MNESQLIDASRLLGAASDGGSQNAILQFAPFLVLGGLLYFLMIRPQRKRQQQVKEMQASLGVGDEVITTSGIYGFIAAEDEQCFWLLIDDEVEIRIARAAVQGKVNPDEGPNEVADDATDDDTDDQADSTDTADATDDDAADQDGSDDATENEENSR